MNTKIMRVYPRFLVSIALCCASSGCADVSSTSDLSTKLRAEYPASEAVVGFVNGLDHLQVSIGPSTAELVDLDADDRDELRHFASEIAQFAHANYVASDDLETISVDMVVGQFANGVLYKVASVEFSADSLGVPCREYSAPAAQQADAADDSSRDR